MTLVILATMPFLGKQPKHLLALPICDVVNFDTAVLAGMAISMVSGKLQVIIAASHAHLRARLTTCYLSAGTGEFC